MHCPICLENINKKFIIKTPCKHEICLGCFINLQTKICPLCRKDYSKELPDFFKAHFTEDKIKLNIFDISDFPPL